MDQRSCCNLPTFVNFLRLTFMLGTSTGYLTPLCFLIFLYTSAASASCGTHFGLTKLVTSTCLSPAATRPSINCTLVATSTCIDQWCVFIAGHTAAASYQSSTRSFCFSFCRPSLGATSTRVTLSGKRGSNGFVPEKSYVSVLKGLRKQKMPEGEAK